MKKLMILAVIFSASQGFASDIGAGPSGSCIGTFGCQQPTEGYPGLENSDIPARPFPAPAPAPAPRPMPMPIPVPRPTQCLKHTVCDSACNADMRPSDPRSSGPQQLCTVLDCHNQIDSYFTRPCGLPKAPPPVEQIPPEDDARDHGEG